MRNILKTIYIRSFINDTIALNSPKNKQNDLMSIRRSYIQCYNFVVIIIGFLSKCPCVYSIMLLQLLVWIYLYIDRLGQARTICTLKSFNHLILSLNLLLWLCPYCIAVFNCWWIRNCVNTGKTRQSQLLHSRSWCAICEL